VIHVTVLPNDSSLISVEMETPSSGCGVPPTQIPRVATSPEIAKLQDYWNVRSTLAHSLFFFFDDVSSIGRQL
jgi:hypothetical protein